MKKEAVEVNILHVLNDGFKASLVLFLPSIAKEFAISLAKVGFLGSAVNSLEILLALPGSHVAAKIGGKKILVGSVFFWALGFLFVGLAPHYLFIIPAFIIAGIGFGVFHPVAFAMISKLFDKGERGRQLGNFTVFGELGRMGLSSLVTVIIVYIGWRSTAMGIAFLLLAIGFYFSRFTSNNVKIEDKTEGEGQKMSYGEILRNKKFVLSTMSFCLDTLASGSIFIFLPFLLLQRHVPYIFLGVLTSTFFLGNLFGKILLGRLVDKFGNERVFIFSEICMAFFIFILSTATWLPLIIISSIILGVFTKGTIPVLITMISESVDHTKGVEKAFGLNAVFVGMASTTALFALGMVSDAFGITTAFSVSAGFALLAIIPALLLGRMDKKS